MVAADFLVEFGTVFRQEVRAQQAECAADAPYFGILGQLGATAQGAVEVESVFCYHPHIDGKVVHGGLVCADDVQAVELGQQVDQQRGNFGLGKGIVLAQ